MHPCFILCFLQEELCGSLLTEQKLAPAVQEALTARCLGVRNAGPVGEQLRTRRWPVRASSSPSDVDDWRGRAAEARTGMEKTARALLGGPAVISASSPTDPTTRDCRSRSTCTSSDFCLQCCLSYSCRQQCSRETFETIELFRMLGASCNHGILPLFLFFPPFVMNAMQAVHRSISCTPVRLSCMCFLLSSSSSENHCCFSRANRCGIFFPIFWDLPRRRAPEDCSSIRPPNRRSCTSSRSQQRFRILTRRRSNSDPAISFRSPSVGRILRLHENPRPYVQSAFLGHGHHLILTGLKSPNETIEMITWSSIHSKS